MLYLRRVSTLIKLVLTLKGLLDVRSQDELYQLYNFDEGPFTIQIKADKELGVLKLLLCTQFESSCHNDLYYYVVIMNVLNGNGLFIDNYNGAAKNMNQWL